MRHDAGVPSGAAIASSAYNGGYYGYYGKPGYNSYAYAPGYAYDSYAYEPGYAYAAPVYGYCFNSRYGYYDGPTTGHVSTAPTISRLSRSDRLGRSREEKGLLFGAPSLTFVPSDRALLEE